MAKELESMAALEELKKLRESATIRFNYSLSVDETIGLLAYVAERVGLRIHYTKQERGTVGISPFDFQTIYAEKGDAEISGQMQRPARRISHLFSSFHNVRGKVTHIDGIEFAIPDSSDETIYGPEVMLLWKDVRSEIGDYFQNRPKNPEPVPEYNI